MIHVDFEKMQLPMLFIALDKNGEMYKVTPDQAIDFTPELFKSYQKKCSVLQPDEPYQGYLVVKRRLSFVSDLMVLRLDGALHQATNFKELVERWQKYYRCGNDEIPDHLVESSYSGSHSGSDYFCDFSRREVQDNMKPCCHNPARPCQCDPNHINFFIPVSGENPKCKGLLSRMETLFMHDIENEADNYNRSQFRGNDPLITSDDLVYLQKVMRQAMHHEQDVDLPIVICQLLGRYLGPYAWADFFENEKSVSYEPEYLI